MEGIVVGISGIEGKLGNGGRVTFGAVGMVGKLGSGGRVGLGKEGCVVGEIGNVGCGRAGIVGNGGNVDFDKLGTEGKGGNCKRLRAAKPISALENEKTTKKEMMKQLKEAIF
ncbi:hypothetical protein P3X46_013772 [Hevea brasiliensis]|uniref:Uncharacterized protein n=2 Tax=Hevea brasiliensis TaxID=3981 RepID=A0ABQ9M8G3_HEVBR|nr:hypothetical protein P3X46_013772 [Hevea brasiliensis]